MKQRIHIAFLIFPHTPHINPTLPIVSALIRRGYRVSYTTSEKFLPAVSELGAEVIRCQEFPSHQALVSDYVPQGRNASFELAERSLLDMTPFYENNKPNLILYDFMFYAGRILAERWNIPAIQTSPALAFDREAVTRPPARSDFRQLLFDMKEKRDCFLESHGIYRTRFLFHRERLNIYLYPRCFQLDGDAFDESCFYAGRSAGERSYRRTWTPKSHNGRPLILVSTSTFYLQGPEYFRMCIDALSDLQFHVVLAIGDNNESALLDVLPSEFEVIQHIPQVQILPHAELLICLGGMITSAEAVYHGVPQLMITHGFSEAEAYAENMVRLGLGIHLRNVETNASNIRGAVNKMLADTALHRRVKRMRDIVRREAGAEETANRIEEYSECRLAC